MLERAACHSFAAIVLLGALAAPCGAQPDDAPVPRPEIKPGDSWTYRRVEYPTNHARGPFTETVTFANDRVIEMLSDRRRDAKELDTTYTADWNLVSSRNTGIFDPDQGLFKFPLRPGDTHEARYEVRFPLKGAYHVRHQRRVKVVGWEEVSVPAGRFRALRLESDGAFERLDTQLSGTAKEVAWYVPEVKRYVKWTYEARSFKGRLQWWGWELVDYKLR
jgi:hypothetical protein